MNDLLQHLPNGYFLLNTDGQMVEVNSLFASWLGKTQETLQGKHVEHILSIANKLMFHSYFYPTLKVSGQVDEMFIHFKHEDGTTVPMLLNAVQSDDTIVCSVMQMKRRFDYEMDLRQVKMQMEQAYQAKEEALRRLEALHHEIEMKQEELIAMNTSLIDMTNTDKLTSIYNRKYFQEILFDCMHTYRLQHTPFSMLLLDIDFFKQVNDTYGHGVGDEVLVQLARVLTENVRANDIVARYGGEEFAIICRDTEQHAAYHLAQHLNQVIEQAMWPVARVTVSIGVYTVQPTDDEQSVVDKADRALYASKHTGRNRATFYVQP